MNLYQTLNSCASFFLGLTISSYVIEQLLPIVDCNLFPYDQGLSKFELILTKDASTLFKLLWPNGF